MNKMRLLHFASIAVVFFLFSWGITDGHIGLDDWGYTSGCPFVKDGLRLQNIARAFSDFGYGAIWMPLTFISYMIDVSVFGDSWRAYHAVNVAFHLINTVLVFYFIKKYLSFFWIDDDFKLSIISIAVSSIWAIHPMRAEAVTFVASRKEELWTLFVLLGLIVFMDFLAKFSSWRFLLVLIFFLAACMSKPTAMCFPFLASSVAFAAGRFSRRVCFALMPLFLIAIGIGVLTLYSQAKPTDAVSVDLYNATFPWRMLNAIVSVGLYVWYTFWPLGIHMDYRAVFGGWPINGWLGISSALVFSWMVLLMILKSSGSLRRCLSGAVLLGMFSLSPTLGVLGYVNGDQAMADRYVYFPHIALCLMCGAGMMIVTGKGISLRIAILVCGVVAALEVFAAIPVVKSYENGYTACCRALKKDPDNWRALRIVGNEYCARMNRVDEGVAMLRKSLKVRPSQLTADSLAYVLAIKGRKEDFAEVKMLGSAISKRPERDENGMMLSALGIVSMRECEFSKAVWYFSKSLECPKRNHSPDYAILYLGQCLANIGRRGEAIRILKELQSHSRISDVAKRAAESINRISIVKENISFKWE